MSIGRPDEAAPHFPNALWATLFKNLFELDVLSLCDVETVALRLNRDLRRQLAGHFLRAAAAPQYDDRLCFAGELRRSHHAWLVWKMFIEHKIEHRHDWRYQHSMYDCDYVALHQLIVGEHCRHSNAVLVQWCNLQRLQMLRELQFAVVLTDATRQMLIDMCIATIRFLRQREGGAVSFSCCFGPSVDNRRLQIRARPVEAVGETFEVSAALEGAEASVVCGSGNDDDAVKERHWSVDCCQLREALRTTTENCQALLLAVASHDTLSDTVLFKTLQLVPFQYQSFAVRAKK